jgi:hypothetical protein
MTFIDVNRVAPSISGVINVSQNYNVLNVGLTDKIFLLGHGDLPTLNDPYAVTDIKAAVAALKYDANSPLMRGLLECYYGQAKDIYLVAVAPMSQYISDPSQRDQSWYATYAAQLQVAYNVIVDWDIVQWIVPLEAPFNVLGVDFLTPLAEHCADSLLATGSMRTGLLGTRKGVALTEAEISAMVADPRITPGNSLYINRTKEIGQYVAVFVGEGLINLQEMPTSYVTSLTASIAGQLCQLPLNRSISNFVLPNIVGLVQTPTSSQTSRIANASLNMMTLTTMGRRGKPFQVICSSDNTLAPPFSDYWCISNTRAVQDIIDVIAGLSRRNLGGSSLVSFQLAVQNYLVGLVNKGMIQNFSLVVNRNQNDSSNIIVNVGIQLYGMLRTIEFVVNVGPGT